MLHIVKHHQSLAQALRYADAEDPVLLVEDGVYATLTAHVSHALLTQNANPFYALLPDIKARGLNKLELAHADLIDFAGFVELTEANETSMTW